MGTSAPHRPTPSFSSLPPPTSACKAGMRTRQTPPARALRPTPAPTPTSPALSPSQPPQPSSPLATAATRTLAPLPPSPTALPWPPPSLSSAPPPWPVSLSSSRETKPKRDISRYPLHFRVPSKLRHRIPFCSYRQGWTILYRSRLLG